MMRAGRTTKEMYLRAVEAFRAAPGNFAGAGRAAGIDWRVAKKLWEDGCGGGDGWGESIEQLLQDEAEATRARLQLAKEQRAHEQRAAKEQADAASIARARDIEEAAAALNEERETRTAEVQARAEAEGRGQVQALAATDANQQMDDEAKAVRALQSNAMMALAVSGLLLRGGLKLAQRLEGMLLELDQPVHIEPKDGHGKVRPPEVIAAMKAEHTRKNVKMGIQLLQTITRISKDTGEMERTGLILERLRLGTPAALAGPLANYDKMSDEELMASVRASNAVFELARQRAAMLPPVPIDPELETVVEGRIPGLQADEPQGEPVGTDEELTPLEEGEGLGDEDPEEDEGGLHVGVV